MLLDEKVSDLIHLIYEAAEHPQAWPVMLNAMASRFRARMTSFIERRPLDRIDSVPFSFGLDPAFRSSYESYYCFRNIYLERASPYLQEGLVATSEMYCTDSDLLASEYYNDFQRQLKLFRVLAGTVACRADYQLLITASRGRYEAPFSHDELVLLEFLLPHVRRAVALGSRLRNAGGTPKPEPAPRALGFTPAEARVAALLAAGSSTDEICAQLGIQMSTARTHLRHLFEKTNTRRQTELVSRLLRDATQLKPL